MTPVRWLLLCLICGGVYLLPQILPQAAGITEILVKHTLGEDAASQYVPAGWFVEQSMWSLLAVWLILEVSTSRMAHILAGIESIAIAVHSLALIQYLYGGGLMFRWDVQIMTGLAVVEAMVLVVGAPWDGLRSIFGNWSRRVTSAFSRMAHKIRG